MSVDCETAVVIMNGQALWMREWRVRENPMKGCPCTCDICPPIKHLLFSYKWWCKITIVRLLYLSPHHFQLWMVRQLITSRDKKSNITEPYSFEVIVHHSTILLHNTACTKCNSTPIAECITTHDITNCDLLSIQDWMIQHWWPTLKFGSTTTTSHSTHISHSLEMLPKWGS